MVYEQYRSKEIPWKTISLFWPHWSLLQLLLLLSHTPKALHLQAHVLLFRLLAPTALPPLVSLRPSPQRQVPQWPTPCCSTALAAALPKKNAPSSLLLAVNASAKHPLKPAGPRSCFYDQRKMSCKLRTTIWINTNAAFVNWRKNSLHQLEISALHCALRSSALRKPGL